MTKRTLMISLNAEWRAGLRAAAKRATARSYQGEVLNFKPLFNQPHHQHH